MKLIIAIIKPFKLDQVKDALAGIGIDGLTVTEVKGFGRQRGQAEVFRGSEYHLEFQPKVKIEVAVPGDLVGSAVAVLTQAAHTGRIGDGKLFVIPIGEAHRIRTGERGDATV